MLNSVSSSQERAKLSWVWLALLVLILDQLTKVLVLKYLAFHEVTRLLPVLNLFLDYNRGAAFSFLHTTPTLAFWVFSLIAIVISSVLAVWMYRLPKSHRWLSAALALILGGAIGNLIDRVRFGYVVDFISFHLGGWYFAVFNVADIAISVGAAMLVVEIIWFSHKRADT